MKLLHASREVGVIERIRCALEGAGIKCMVRNEMTAFLQGRYPFGECTPEVWIIEDEQVVEAQQILAALERDIGRAGAFLEMFSMR